MEAAGGMQESERLGVDLPVLYFLMSDLLMSDFVNSLQIKMMLIKYIYRPF
jgi:hypothetical protein